MTLKTSLIINLSFQSKTLKSWGFKWFVAKAVCITTVKSLIFVEHWLLLVAQSTILKSRGINILINCLSYLILIKKKQHEFKNPRKNGNIWKTTKRNDFTVLNILLFDIFQVFDINKLGNWHCFFTQCSTLLFSPFTIDSCHVHYNTCHSLRKSTPLKISLRAVMGNQCSYINFSNTRIISKQ